MNLRIQKLIERLDEARVDGLLVTDPLNVAYLLDASDLTGIEPLDVTVVIGRDGLRVVTDSRYWEAIERHGNPEQVRITLDLPRPRAAAEAAAQLGVKTLGFEAVSMTVQTLKEWTKAGRGRSVKYKPTVKLVEGLRRVKDEVELDRIRRASRITDEAFEHFCTQVKPGMTEKQGAWIIESYMRTHGAESTAFEPIVASGPNAALAHAVPTDRQFQLGEPIILDIGSQVDGYKSDMTRTICLGQPPDRFKKVYDVVLKAQKSAEKRIRAGVRGKRADAFARRVIEKADFGDQFGHGLGHGVGLAIHEGPSAGRVSKDVFEQHMTVTVEPGIYIPGWGGVRIEDLTVINADGVEILNHATKDPVVRV